LGKPWDGHVTYGEYLRTLDASDPRQLAILHSAGMLFRGAGYTPFDGEVPDTVIQAAIGAPYAHTTAPLRRLVDRFVLIVCSYAVRGLEVPEAVREALPLLPKLMGASNQLVNKVERAAIDTVEAATLAHRVGEKFAAVTLTGTLPASGSPAGSNGSNGRKSRGTLQLVSPAVTATFEGHAAAGQNVEVELVTADLLTRAVLFRIVE
jgi:hypothetical protein